MELGRCRVEKLGTMSEVFEGYERQYCEQSANLSRQCTAASALDGGNAIKSLSSHTLFNSTLVLLLLRLMIFRPLWKWKTMGTGRML